ncbi:tetraacyldisaccharide 4'-kinase [Ferrigenium kumadai]|uniref:Tetraacyldisaccharide 4'-kinase n=1 Tax=Ferrigenium kumadai TaxID=1682490 RepID=A0AAN1T0R5_9PROT|nr:tetraacyldisaccharide 4'-kinase [Ferrigenium kumadai]BBI99254.1 tetraacyldisaccharide 4'-kinase [Ferrigenium kumadai]
MSGLERHWYRITPLHLILYPVSLIFRLLAALRRALYRAGLLHSVRLPVPVVVVGNISVGGTGKTPLTLALAQQLIERGMHPLIVSRGHGGDTGQPRAVTLDSDARSVGDEPLLMARRQLCPVWVGKDRAAAAQTGLQANPQCDVVLCDDGLQHYRLQRDAEIAVVDGARGLGNGMLLPAGPLREPAGRLRTVDAVVVNGGETTSGQYAMNLDGAVFYNLLDPARIVTAAHFHALRNHAVAGIGNPRRYFLHLESLGIAFTPHPFPDHHPYRAEELAFADCDAILLTEKDAVKCAAFADERYWVLRVDARIDPALTAHILRKIAPHGR